MSFPAGLGVLTLTNEDLLETVASATTLSLPSLTVSGLTCAPGPLPLSWWACLMCSATLDRPTIATLPRVERNTLGRLVLHTAVASNETLWTGSRLFFLFLLLSSALPPSTLFLPLLCDTGTRYALLKTLFLKGC